MKELTRTIQVQVTDIIDMEGEDGKIPVIKPAEIVKKDIEYMFRSNTQVLVTVKDFVSDGKKRGKK